MPALRVQGRCLTCSDIVAQSIKRSDNYLRFYVFRNCEPNMNPLLILFAAQLVQAMSAPQPGSCHVTLVERAQIGHGQSGLDHLKSDLLGPIKKAKDAFVQVAVAEVGYQFVRANVPALGTYASNANVLRHVKVAKDALCTNLCRSGFGKQVGNRLNARMFAWCAWRIAKGSCQCATKGTPFAGSVRATWRGTSSQRRLRVVSCARRALPVRAAARRSPSWL